MGLRERVQPQVRSNVSGESIHSRVQRREERVRNEPPVYAQFFQVVVLGFRSDAAQVCAELRQLPNGAVGCVQARFGDQEPESDLVTEDITPSRVSDRLRLVCFFHRVGVLDVDNGAPQLPRRTLVPS